MSTQYQVPKSLTCLHFVSERQNTQIADPDDVDDMRQRLNQFVQLTEAIISNATLLAEMVMVGRDELAEKDFAARLMFYQVVHLPRELVHLIAEGGARRGAVVDHADVPRR